MDARFGSPAQLDHLFVAAFVVASLNGGIRKDLTNLVLGPGTHDRAHRNARVAEDGEEVSSRNASRHC